MLTYAALFCGTVVLSFLLAYPVRRLALAFDIVDHPEKRKMHQIPIPLLGGVPIFVAFVVVSMIAFRLGDGFTDSNLRAYLGMMAGSLVVVLVGLYDDIKGLKAPAKFAGQALAALVVVALGGRVDLFTNPLGNSFHLGLLGIPIAVLWIVGVTNAVNLIDGLDGLAAGIGSIACLGMFAVAFPDNAFVATCTIVLAGATVGFLRHNFYPARMFLGDTGSMFIGFTLAVIALHGSLKATTATVLFLPIIVLGVPIFDTLFAIVRRARRRVSPFKADRQHIHHRLVRIGLHHRNVVLVMYFVCAYLALNAYSIAQFPYQTALLFLVLLTMGGIIGLRTLQFVEEKLEADLGAVATGSTAAVGSGVPNGKTRNAKKTRNAGQPPEEYSTMICEVSGLRDEPADSDAWKALCGDVRTMLSRRVRVYSVYAEPSRRGCLVILLRTERLTPSMEALVRDGLAWYLEDHKEQYSVDMAVSQLNWIVGDAPRPTTEDGTSGSGSRRAEVRAPMPFREGSTGAVRP